MFVGTYNLVVNENWEMPLPNFILGKLGRKVFMRLGKNEILEIHPEDVMIYPDTVSEWFSIKIKNKKVKIPLPLRNSTSFFFGKRITLVARASYFIVWPRP